MKDWEASDPRTRGRIPGYPCAGYVYPAMYRDNMFVRTGTYTASIKVFIRNTCPCSKTGTGCNLTICLKDV